MSDITDALRYCVAATMNNPTTAELLEELKKALEAGSYNSNPTELFPNTIPMVDLDRLASDFDVTVTKESCNHDWVTWTGLHGTITDCTKCKAIKNENSFS